MHRTTHEALVRALGQDITSTRPIAGGCINEAEACQLADGREVFVKHHRGCDANMFAAEEAGLRWLAEPEALRVPSVLAVGADFLALEYIRPGKPAADWDEQLGRGLAQVHRALPDGFGGPTNNFLATLLQDNSSEPSWAEFYAERRLRPLLRLAVDQGQAPARWIRPFEELFVRLPALVGDPEPPARLHGDLWSGNVHTDERGAPVLIDPAVYGGHREVDLAMLRLFGAPSSRFYAAYESIWPLAPDHEQRVALYQLYPLLVHVQLFGGSYLGSCETALRSYL